MALYVSVGAFRGIQPIERNGIRDGQSTAFDPFFLFQASFSNRYTVAVLLNPILCQFEMFQFGLQQEMDLQIAFNFNIRQVVCFQPELRSNSASRKPCLQTAQDGTLHKFKNCGQTFPVMVHIPHSRVFGPMLAQAQRQPQPRISLHSNASAPLGF